jgi:glutathione S-transferase
MDNVSKIILQKLPPIVKYLGAKKYLTGDQPCWVDFYFFELIQLLIFLSEGSILQNFPSLHAYNVNFKQLPGLKEYLVTCQDKDLVFNGGIAKVNGKLGF